MKNKSLIPNSLVEEMFLRIANDQNMVTYVNYVNQDNLGLATAYASKLVYLKFMELVEL